MIDIHAKRILIIDFGSQYTQLIARRVRELGVYSEIHSDTMTADEIKAFAPSGIILSGALRVSLKRQRRARLMWSLPWEFQSLVFVTACKRWRSSWAGRFQLV